MNWLILLFAIELGWAPNYESYNIALPDAELNVTQNIGYVLFEAEVVAWDTFFIGGATKTYVQPITLNAYHPFESDYLFNAGLRFGELEIGYRHFCLHPNRPHNLIYNTKGDTDAGYEEFYIRIEIKK